MVLVNGVEQSTLSIADRGLQYGDGLFETIAVRNNKIEFLQSHYQRLCLGAERLGFAVPELELLLSESQQLIESSEMSEGMLKWMVTRGEGGRGYRSPESIEPTRILTYKPWPYTTVQQTSAESEGVRLRLCNTRLAENPALAGIKHLNRLEQVLARNEWNEPEIVEGVVMNRRDELIEGTMSNLFFVRDQEVITPDLSQCGVAGVMRSQILNYLAEQGRAVTVRAVPLQELESFDELFCSNSLIGVWPVRQMDAIRFNAPGLITQDCIQWLNRGS